MYKTKRNNFTFTNKITPPMHIVHTSEVIYKGELRTVLTHIKSGQQVITDAPLNNNGKGEAFSSTDLLATSLGSYMLTVMGIKARSNNINIDGTRAEILKVMAENPRRVSEIYIDIFFPPNNYTQREKNLLERTALHCPVAKSLHLDIKQIVRFHY
jgi:uncharacterized OsmC-like protein